MLDQVYLRDSHKFKLQTTSSNFPLIVFWDCFKEIDET